MADSNFLKNSGKQEQEVQTSPREELFSKDQVSRKPREPGLASIIDRNLIRLGTSMIGGGLASYFGNPMLAQAGAQAGEDIINFLQDRLWKEELEYVQGTLTKQFKDRLMQATQKFELRTTPVPLEDPNFLPEETIEQDIQNAPVVPDEKNKSKTSKPGVAARKSIKSKILPKSTVMGLPVIKPDGTIAYIRTNDLEAHQYAVESAIRDYVQDLHTITTEYLDQISQYQDNPYINRIAQNMVSYIANIGTGTLKAPLQGAETFKARTAADDYLTRRQEIEARTANYRAQAEKGQVETRFGQEKLEILNSLPPDERKRAVFPSLSQPGEGESFVEQANINSPSFINEVALADPQAYATTLGEVKQSLDKIVTGILQNETAVDNTRFNSIADNSARISIAAKYYQVIAKKRNGEDLTEEEALQRVAALDPEVYKQSLYNKKPAEVKIGDNIYKLKHPIWMYNITVDPRSAIISELISTRPNERGYIAVNTVLDDRGKAAYNEIKTKLERVKKKIRDLERKKASKENKMELDRLRALEKDYEEKIKTIEEYAVNSLIGNEDSE